jgi:hypothetical protein
MPEHFDFHASILNKVEEAAEVKSGAKPKDLYTDMSSGA